MQWQENIRFERSIYSVVGPGLRGPVSSEASPDGR